MVRNNPGARRARSFFFTATKRINIPAKSLGHRLKRARYFKPTPEKVKEKKLLLRLEKPEL